MRKLLIELTDEQFNDLEKLALEDMRTKKATIVYLLNKDIRYRELKKGIKGNQKIIAKENDYQVITDDDMQKSLELLKELKSKKGA